MIVSPIPEPEAERPIKVPFLPAEAASTYNPLKFFRKTSFEIIWSVSSFVTGCRGQDQFETDILDRRIRLCGVCLKFWNKTYRSSGVVEASDFKLNEDMYLASYSRSPVNSYTFKFCTVAVSP